MIRDLSRRSSINASSSFGRGLLSAVLGVGTLLTCLGISSNAEAFGPKRVLIYYGYPSLINGSAGNLTTARNHFAQYDYVVFGRELELSHPDHQNTINIIAQLPATTHVYGYVHIGNTGPGNTRLCMINAGDTTNSYGPPCIRQRSQAWAAMGVEGILLDEFGFDYGNDRARQNAAIQEVHNWGGRVIANAWNPADVFGGGPININSTDFYFFESHIVKEGAWQDMTEYKNKAELLNTYHTQRQFLIMSITTDAASSTYSDERYRVSWTAALIYDHEATGWGEPGFSPNSVAPFRTPPTPYWEDQQWYTYPLWQGTWLSRGADVCTYDVRFDNHTAGACR